MHVLTRSEPVRTPLRTRTFDVVAIQMPIVYNEVRDNTDPARRWMGHHDHDGLIYTLAEHREALEALRERIEAKNPDAARPHPLVRPVVLRAGKGERVVYRWGCSEEGVFCFSDLGDRAATSGPRTPTACSAR
jgi:hypothetical protein